MLESFCFSETKYFRFSQCLLTRTMKKLENKHTFFHILSPCFIIDAFVLYSVTPQLPQRLPLVIFIMASLFLSLLIFFIIIISVLDWLNAIVVIIIFFLLILQHLFVFIIILIFCCWTGQFLNTCTFENVR